MTTPVGQYAYAGTALLARKGLTEADRDPIKASVGSVGGGVGGWSLAAVVVVVVVVVCVLVG